MTPKNDRNGVERVALKYDLLDLGRRGEYVALYGACQEWTSDYTFVNLWAWTDECRYEWAFDSGFCWLRIMSPLPTNWAPVGNWIGVDWKPMLKRLFPEGAVFERVPEPLSEIWRRTLGTHARIEEQRSEWEYVYPVGDLISLKGNRLHAKRNLLMQFRRLYDWTYEEIGRDDIDEILALQGDWCRWRNCDDTPGLRAENHAITRILCDWDNLPGLMGGLLRVDGRPVAYTIAEGLSSGGPDMLVIHFEKGFTDYKGIYQAINQTFLERSGSAYRRVNREQDMGSESIRQAKESYNPSGYLKKYRVTWLG